MSIEVFLVRAASRIVLSVGIAFLSSNAFALDYPAPTAADPLRLRACPVTFFGSVSHSCELMGLTGAVSRVSYSFSRGSNEPDLIYQLDTNGRVAEVHQRIRDALGGWGRRKFSYGSDGALTTITYNERPNSDFQYADGKLVNFAFHSDMTSCTYSFSGTDKISIEADCKNKYRIFQYRGEMDSRGRILKLDPVGAQQLNTQGPLECTWTVEGKQSSSQCSDGYYMHRFDYDERMRPVSYSRKANSGKESLILSFSYVEDSSGNWTAQTIHYVEMSSTKQLPGDVVRSRTIEYFK
jgi:hypothetical protein